MPADSTSVHHHCKAGNRIPPPCFIISGNTTAMNSGEWQAQNVCLNSIGPPEHRNRERSPPRMSHLKSQSVTSNPVIPLERIERRILLIRGQKVMLDADLAGLYGVPTKKLNQAVKRNVERFPEDFMFRLTKHEAAAVLRSQFVTSNDGRGGRRYNPYAFTEQGVAMLSSVLRSPPRHPGQHRHHARLCQAERDSRHPSRSGAAPRRDGEQIRCAVQGSLRCHPRADDAATEIPAPHRIHCVGRRTTAPHYGAQIS